MPLSKSCPECHTVVNVKKSGDCGHCFVLKCKVSCDTARKSKRIAMKCKRALEPLVETIHRQEQSRALMAKKRSLESAAETIYRQEQNRAQMAKNRSLESAAETIHRQEQNRALMAKKRSLESAAETIYRQEQNRALMAKKRSKNIFVDDAITTFLLKAKMGPDYVCTCCHRMMYKQNVVVCKKSKYTNRPVGRIYERGVRFKVSAREIFN